MNFPLWDIPAPGLLIAGVAILHVFISHFAVGGGLFLVLAERKARREGDDALLAFVERHSKFFALVTLVTGALTGVGIWFTIGLINPSATASLIASFVWGWAIEWTFFVTEIAAAIVYVYGWHRLSPAVHLRVGWVYFIAAWLSLAVINGILTFMLTPGAWVTTHGFWAGILNPTYLPSLVTRTAGAVVLAGVYALLTASWMANRHERARVARYAATRWVLPGAVVMPIGIAWYLGAASAAGVRVAAAFGAASRSIPAIVRAAFSAPASGQPMAERAVMVFALASAVLIVVTVVIAGWRASRYGRPSATVAMICALLTIGAAEWIREDLRKPYILGDYMFVTGVRLPAPEGAALPAAPGGDRFALDVVEQRGVLKSALWSHPVLVTGDATVDAIARGHEVFRLSCSQCHTIDGYNAVRPLVHGMSVAAASGLLERLARPIDASGQPASWALPHVGIDSWRGRRMPPFAGTADERQALAAYLASLGGMTPEAIAQASAAASLGARVFEEHCSVCHGKDGPFPFKGKGRTADQFYGILDRLPTLNAAMPPFDGTDQERRALADYLPGIDGSTHGGSR